MMTHRWICLSAILLALSILGCETHQGGRSLLA